MQLFFLIRVLWCAIMLYNCSAQITTLDKPEALIGTQVICCVNLAPIHNGSVNGGVRISGKRHCFPISGNRWDETEIRATGDCVLPGLADRCFMRVLLSKERGSSEYPMWI